MPKPEHKLSREQAEQIRQARLAAVVRKVKDGKSLTLGEQRLIDSMTEPERADRATWPEWCASMRQAGVLIGQTWSRMKWAKAHGSPGFHASGRVNPRLVASWLDVQEATKPPQQAPIAIEVKERSLEEELRDLNMLLAQFDRAATVAMSANDLERSASVNEQTKTAATRREQIWKQMGRLGRNDEEALNKSEVVRIIRALAIQSIHGLQRTAREAAGKLQGITDPADVFRILTSEMTAEAFARPFNEAAKLEAAHGLPSWVADEMIGSVARMTE
jgi:hypothetical protein